ncbi:alpha/beta hydrolase [Kribbella sandramycini]|uniref:Alpha/beta hydrolase n=1 Tax=Kribbella sandramycini TaxID=60450 RepID=A0A7Y4P1J0_9ACTN|nr:alpha/beta hydrolase [Kribbella sandramycini]MBB6564463.1 pimeloyl-ACP methyl ester carboxylesterase [Kribbella sandramycini]NOL42169.1 alpha/beta hydrolase [Kribbella sandramycini]
MHVTSADGTAIAYDRVGRGAPLVLVPGALCDRNALRPLADELAGSFDVISYDRRGRGDSGDSTAYVVQREVEDIAALVQALGGGAAVYGHSSGAGLTAIAAGSGLPFSRVVLHEPPYGSDDVDSSEDGAQVLSLLADGQNREAVELFLVMAGMPTAEALEFAGSPGVAELAPTLAYDFAVMDHGARGGGLPAELLAGISQPTLVLAGTASPPFMVDAAHRAVKLLSAGTLTELPDQGHVVAPELLAPVLRTFLSPR